MFMHEASLVILVALLIAATLGSQEAPSVSDPLAPVRILEGWVAHSLLRVPQAPSTWIS